jgi:hypothetical protein
MARHVAILHGWSDHSDSFKPLASFLKKQGYRTVPLFLGDYISLRDDVKIDDVAKRMEEVIRDRMAKPAGKRGHLAKKFDMIVHSTGGLVARRWISEYYADDPTACPLRNLVMLAPANFGSKLAHKGRSMLGRVVKGWKTGFETGDEMLYALELGSPFQWDLAESDMFVTPSAKNAKAFYGPDAVRPFVIVGTHPYAGRLADITNEDGSDGTVRVAAANMNTYGRTVDFSGDESHLLSPQITEWRKRGGKDNRFPLAVLPDRDHGNITEPEEPGYSKDPAVQANLGRLILQALGAADTPAAYAKVRDAWEAVTRETRTFAGEGDDAQKHRDAVFKRRKTRRELFHEYYQVFVRAEDEFGVEIPDYFLSFMPRTKKHWYSLRASLSKPGVYFHDEVLEDVHTHRRTNANRCLFLDRFDMMKAGGFYDLIKEGNPKELSVTVTAADPGDNVGYFTRGSSGKRGLVLLHQKGAPQSRWLRRHSTHFLKIIVPRAADPDVFKMKRG